MESERRKPGCADTPSAGEGAARSGRGLEGSEGKGTEVVKVRDEVREIYNGPESLEVKAEDPDRMSVILSVVELAFFAGPLAYLIYLIARK